PILAVERAAAAADRTGELDHRPPGRVAPPLRAEEVLTDARRLFNDVTDESGRRVGGLVDVPHERRGEVVLPVRGAAGGVLVQPLIELRAQVEVDVAARAEREDRPVG